MTVTLYIGIANLIGLLGFKPPTKDMNVTAALAFMSIVLIEVAGIRQKGAKGWAVSYTHLGIIMDPPSYGRGPKGEIWKIEEKIYSLVCLCEKLLSKDPLFFLINSYTTGLQPAVLSYMLGTAVAKKHGGKVSADEVGLPVLSLIHI